MFGLDDLRKTKVAQEFIEEGRQEEKLEVILASLERGLDIETISAIVHWDVEKVRKVSESLQKE